MTSLRELRELSGVRCLPESSRGAQMSVSQAHIKKPDPHASYLAGATGFPAYGVPGFQNSWASMRARLAF